MYRNIYINIYIYQREELILRKKRNLCFSIHSVHFLEASNMGKNLITILTKKKLLNKA